VHLPKVYFYGEDIPQIHSNSSIPKVYSFVHLPGVYFYRQGIPKVYQKYTHLYTYQKVYFYGLGIPQVYLRYTWPDLTWPIYSLSRRHTCMSHDFVFWFQSFDLLRCINEIYLAEVSLCSWDIHDVWNRATVSNDGIKCPILDKIVPDDNNNPLSWFPSKFEQNCQVRSCHP